MKVELKCKCGATVIFEDSRGVYIKSGGRPDEKGRKYSIELWVDGWLDRHSVCLGISEN